MLNAKEIQGLYPIIPTPAKPGAEKLTAENTVDLDETARVVDKLIADGCNGLIALGTTGECPTLSQTDYEAFVGCVLETVNRRVPTFIGATAMGGHEVAKRMKFIRDCGADGALLGLPMWQPMTVDTAVNFYQDIAEIFPDVAVMVYANERAFRFSFPDEFWEAVSHLAPNVVAAKYPRPKNLKHLIDSTGGRINFMPNEMTISYFFQHAPESTTAYWATAASMGPQPTIELMSAFRRGDSEMVKLLTDAMAWANAPIAPSVADSELFARYNIQVEKARINAAGYCFAGPVRPPYGAMPVELTAASEECGRRWAALCARIASGTVLGDLIPA